MPVNTDMLANAAMPAVRQKYTFGNMAEIELHCLLYLETNMQAYQE